jgi:FkbM family methyltransferase
MNISFYKKFQFKIGFKKKIISLIKKKIFLKIFGDFYSNLNIVLPVNDKVLKEYIIDKIYEEDITRLISFLNKNKYNDFLIDIGANFGLTSCQNGNKFKFVHLYEPNRECINLLKINLSLNFLNNNYQIHPYGLGEKNHNTILNIPKYNCGGAFVLDKNNSYNLKILSQKDGFNSINMKNYYNIPIVIKDAKLEFKKIFKEFKIKKFNYGIIKIDVEGYELTILKNLSKVYPKSLKTFIIFESHNKNLEIDKIKEYFKNHSMQISKLETILPYKKKNFKIFKLFYLIFKPIKLKINNEEIKDWSGNIILKIN